MRKESRYLALAVMAVLALSLSACKAGSGSNSDSMKAQLSKNTSLKKGWSELPVPIYISNSVPEIFRPVIIEAMDKWNSESGVTLFVYAGETPDDVRTQDEINGIYWNESPHQEGYFGLTQTLSTTDDVIVESDITFYDDPEGFDVLECEGGEEICRSSTIKKDIMTTALHELGHVLGFNHTAGPTDIMNPNFYPGDVHHQFDGLLIAELQDTYDTIMLADAR